MNRRDAIQRLGLLAGMGLSSGTISALLAGCRAPSGETPYTFRMLNGAALAWVTAMTDHIIPPTDTPGASDVGVPVFVDTLLAEYVEATERALLLDGLDQLMTTEPDPSAAAAGRIDTAAFASGASDAAASRAWQALKEWTVVGYYTSEAGARAELDIMPFGPFRNIASKTTWA